ESFESREEALHFLVPRQRRGVVPLFLPSCHGERPVEQVADVRQDLARRAARFRGVVTGEFGRSAAHGFAAAIGQRGEGVAKKIALRIGCHRKYYGKYY